MILEWWIESLIFSPTGYLFQIIDSTISEGKHADISIFFSIPLAVLDNLRHYSNNVLTAMGCLLLKVVAFIGGVQSEDILLFEYLKIVEYNNHPNFDLLLTIIKKQDEIYLYFFDGIRQGRCILGLAFEGLFWFNATNYT